MMNKRILLLGDIDEYGGTGEYFKRLVKHFSPSHMVQVIFYPGRRKLEIEKVARECNVHWSTDYVILPQLDDFLRRLFRKIGVGVWYLFIRDAFVAVRIARKYRPDLVVVSQGGGLNYFAFLLARVPVLIVLHSLFDPSSVRFLGSRQYLRLFNNIDLRIKKICCVSDFALGSFRSGIRSKQLSECAFALPNYANDMIAESCGDKDSAIILTIGHVVDYKNPDLWFQIAEAVVSRFKSRVRFVWAGAGDRLEEFKRLSDHTKGISFIGFQENVKELYLKSMIYFQPSLYESQGIAVIEAMSAGIPCVVSDAGGLRESVEDGVEGFVCSALATGEYVEAISRLVDDADLRRRMGKAARSKYENKYRKAEWEERMECAVKSLIVESERSSSHSSRSVIGDKVQ